MLTVGTALADNADPMETAIRDRLAAQGYEGIEITRKDGQFQVQARRDKLIVETVYDANSGEVISERMRQADASAPAEK